MSVRLKLFSLMILLISFITYFICKIYESSIILYSVPILVLLPIIMIIVTRGKRKGILDKILGHYLFYLNYIIVGIIFIGLISIILSLFRINLINLLKNNKFYFNIIFLLYLSILGIRGSINFKKLNIKKYEVPILKSNSVESMKIGFISDIHLSDKFNGDVLKKSFKLMEEEKVEIIVITGDIIDFSYKTIKDDIKDKIKDFKFKYGIYAVLGNHEYYGGIEGNEKYIRDLGISILRDERIEINGINFIGRDDNHNKRRKSLYELLKKVDENKNTIILDHNPIGVKEMKDKKDKKEILYLSGHTHNGQLFPFNILVKYMYENAYGYKKNNGFHSVVTSGLGTWVIPYRISSKSEIVILNLRRSL
ncbi:MAG: metallophosphoesterase [Fusobacteriaceae bacterium]